MQLSIDLSRETLVLAGTEADGLQPAQLASVIAKNEPRYSFYRHGGDGATLFVYTCPSASSIKQRMLYASSRASTVSTLAPEHGLTIKGKLEATDPDDVTEEAVLAELGLSAAATETGSAPGAGGGSRGFSRPKRPGRK